MTAAAPRRRLLSQSQLIIGVSVSCSASSSAPSSRASPRARAELFRPFAALFLRLIKMIVAPLIFSSLVAGIAGAVSHGRRIGRMGFRAITSTSRWSPRWRSSSGWRR